MSCYNTNSQNKHLRKRMTLTKKNVALRSCECMLWCGVVSRIDSFLMTNLTLNLKFETEILFAVSGRIQKLYNADVELQAFILIAKLTLTAHIFFINPTFVDKTHSLLVRTPSARFSSRNKEEQRPKRLIG